MLSVDPKTSCSLDVLSCFLDDPPTTLQLPRLLHDFSRPGVMTWQRTCVCDVARGQTSVGDGWNAKNLSIVEPSHHNVCQYHHWGLSSPGPHLHEWALLALLRGLYSGCLLWRSAVDSGVSSAGAQCRLVHKASTHCSIRPLWLAC